MILSFKDLEFLQQQILCHLELTSKFLDKVFLPTYSLLQLLIHLDHEVLLLLIQFSLHALCPPLLLSHLPLAVPLSLLDLAPHLPHLSIQCINMTIEGTNFLIDSIDVRIKFYGCIAEVTLRFLVTTLFLFQSLLQVPQFGLIF